MNPNASRPGTARDALSVPAFRRIFFASFVSNGGRWMQGTAQGVLAWELTERSAYLGLLIFAQLVPLALLSLVGGSLADSADRRKLLIVTQTWQMLGSGLLAVLLIDDFIDPTLLVIIVFITALGQGIYAPTFTSVLPTLAGPRNIGAAVSLNSMQVNASRVIGPAIGGFLTSQVGFAEVFAINAISYVAVIVAVYLTPIPAPEKKRRSISERLFGGFRIAANAPQVGRPLVVMSLFSLFCLPFIGQLPALAELNLNIEATSTAYGYFYAVFGLGALSGTLLVGTVLVHRPRASAARLTMVAFAAALAWLNLAETINMAYFAVFFVGLFYLVLPTTLTTMWQEHVDDSVRGRVSALWVLSFGGTVPFAAILAGPLVEITSLRLVLYGGSVAALTLAAFARFPTGPIVGEEFLAGLGPRSEESVRRNDGITQRPFEDLA